MSIGIDHRIRFHAVIRKRRHSLRRVGRPGRQSRTVGAVEEALDHRPLAVPVFRHQVVHARVSAVSVLTSLGADENKEQGQDSPKPCYRSHGNPCHGPRTQSGTVVLGGGRCGVGESGAAGRANRHCLWLSCNRVDGYCAICCCACVCGCGGTLNQKLELVDIFLDTCNMG